MVDTTELWSSILPSIDGAKASVPSLAFKPDGTKIAACSGRKVLVYETLNGKLIYSLKGHKGTVNSVSYAHDGHHLASGSSDNTTIIWSDAEGKGTLKFSHTDSVQVVVYNPVRELLASCSSCDFGFWSPTGKSVTKHGVGSKIRCAAWTSDGEVIAIGMFSGSISLREIDGTEKLLISRSAPVWTLDWSPNVAGQDTLDVLAVGCWDKTLSFYARSGTHLYKDRSLSFYPCSVTYYGEKGEFLIICGSEKKVSFYSQEGVKLTDLSSCDDWIWAVKGHPEWKTYATADNGGRISYTLLTVPDVYAVGDNRFARREGGTDVLVTHLQTDQKARIKCKEFVEKIAIFRNRLAIQVSSQILIYEVPPALGPCGMRYKIKDKADMKLTYDAMAIGMSNLILCSSNKVEVFNAKGLKIREWMLQSAVCAIKVIGGPSKREGLVAGHNDGSVSCIFINNILAVDLMKHSCAISSLDVNLDRSHVALIDCVKQLYIYDMTKSVVFHDIGPVNSVVFDAEDNRTFCYTGNGALTIRTIEDVLQFQMSQGNIINFCGSQLNCLDGRILRRLELETLPILQNHIEKKEYSKALKVANSGICEAAWMKFAYHAFFDNDLDTALKAFHHLKESAIVDLIHREKTAVKHYVQELGILEKSRFVFAADFQALRMNYHAAGKLYAKAQENGKAVSMFVSMRKWGEAKEYAVGHHSAEMQNILIKEAEWAESQNDWERASKVYVDCNNMLKAVKIIGDTKGNSWENALIAIVRKNLSNKNTAELELCGEYFLSDNMDDKVNEVYKKLGDYTKLMQLYVANKNWLEAEALYAQHSDKLNATDALPYGKWLIGQERLEEAFSIYRSAGRWNESERHVQALAANAVVESRYKDACYLYWILFKSQNAAHLNSVPTRSNFDYENLYQWFYAYDVINDYCNESFTRSDPILLLQVSSFLLNSMSWSTIPKGISLVSILITLAKQAKRLEAYQVAQFAYKYLQTLKNGKTISV